MIFGIHLFKQKEFEQSRKHGMDALVIGKGTDSVAKISARCKEFMETNGVALIELLSESAIQKLSQHMSNQKGLKQ